MVYICMYVYIWFYFNYLFIYHFVKRKVSLGCFIALHPGSLFSKGTFKGFHKNVYEWHAHVAWSINYINIFICTFLKKINPFLSEMMTIIIKETAKFLIHKVWFYIEFHNPLFIILGIFNYAWILSTQNNAKQRFL